MFFRVLVSVLLFPLLFLLACGGEKPSVVDVEKAKKKFVAAIDATLVPMSFVNDKKELTGFEVDLIREVANAAGFSIELVNVEWVGLFGGLITQKYDLAISSVTILEERKQRMAFSIPYLRSGIAMVVRSETEDIKTLGDLKAKRAKVGAQLSTTSYFLLEKNPEIQVKGYQQYGHAIADLIKGEIDAVIGESTGTLYYKTHEKALFKKIKMVGETMTDEYYGIVMRKEDTALKTRVDTALRRLIESGTVQKLHDKWDLGKAASVPDLP